MSSFHSFFYRYFHNFMWTLKIIKILNLEKIAILKKQSIQIYIGVIRRAIRRVNCKLDKLYIIIQCRKTIKFSNEYKNSCQYIEMLTNSTKLYHKNLRISYIPNIWNTRAGMGWNHMNLPEKCKKLYWNALVMHVIFLKSFHQNHFNVF